MKKIVILALILTSITAFAKDEISLKQLESLNNYIRSNVENKTLEEVNKLNFCGSLAKFFNQTLFISLTDRALLKLNDGNNLDQKMVNNYMILGIAYTTNLLIEKKYIDELEPDNDYTKSTTKKLYIEKCSSI